MCSPISSTTLGISPAGPRGLLTVPLAPTTSSSAKPRSASLWPALSDGSARDEARSRRRWLGGSEFGVLAGTWSEAMMASAREDIVALGSEVCCSCSRSCSWCWAASRTGGERNRRVEVRRRDKHATAAKPITTKSGLVALQPYEASGSRRRTCLRSIHTYV